MPRRKLKSFSFSFLKIQFYFYRSYRRKLFSFYVPRNFFPMYLLLVLYSPLKLLDAGIRMRWFKLSHISLFNRTTKWYAINIIFFLFCIIYFSYHSHTDSVGLFNQWMKRSLMSSSVYDESNCDLNYIEWLLRR